MPRVAKDRRRMSQSQSQPMQADSGLVSMTGGPPARTVRYWSCSHEELITLQIEAWELGGAGARADGPRVLRELTAIEQRAERACEAALLIYVPLDLARFRDVFTLAWVGGYYAARGPDERQMARPDTGYGAG